MRAFHVTSHQNSPVLDDRDAPEPGAAQIRVDIAACGLNFADLLMLNGTYQETPPLPFIPGMEVAGTVAAVGKDVRGFASGDRVAVFGGHGGLAEAGCFDAAHAVHLPDSMPFTDAAAFQVAYGTGHVALSHRARLAAGETLLVLGAAGGVGLAAVDIGRQMGARVVACARGREKLAAAEAAGADVLIDTQDDDIRSVMKRLGGADVVYDPVGGTQFNDAFRSCRPEARILTIGFASGDVPQIKANHLLVKNVSVLGLYWGGYLKFRPEVLTQSLATLLEWYVAGRIKPHISHILPLERTAEGLELMRSRTSTGKIVIRMQHR